MSKYLHFYRGYNDSYEQLHCEHTTTDECATCLANKGGYIIKAQDVKVET